MVLDRVNNIPFTDLVCSSPILFALKHPPPEHGHYFRVVLIGESVLGYFGHKVAMRPPSVIIGGLPHLGFNLRVVHDHIGPGNVVKVGIGKRKRAVKGRKERAYMVQRYCREEKWKEGRYRECREEKEMEGGREEGV